MAYLERHRESPSQQQPVLTAFYFSLFVRRSPMCNQPSINKATITGKKDLGAYSSHVEEETIFPKIQHNINTNFIQQL